MTAHDVAPNCVRALLGKVLATLSNIASDLYLAVNDCVWAVHIRTLWALRLLHTETTKHYKAIYSLRSSFLLTIVTKIWNTFTSWICHIYFKFYLLDNVRRWYKLIFTEATRFYQPWILLSDIMYLIIFNLSMELSDGNCNWIEYALIWIPSYMFCCIAPQRHIN